MASLIFMISCGDGQQSALSDAVIQKDNPLEPCPPSPNCFRITLAYNIPVDEMLKQSKTILKDMGATEINFNPNRHRLEAIFTIWLFRFKDDVVLQAEQSDEKNYLYIRSASRKGYSDLGVNRHRISTFIKRLEKSME